MNTSSALDTEWVAHIDPHGLLSALMDDADARVTLMDAQGDIRLANEVVTARYRPDDRPDLVGLNIGRLFENKAEADELLGYVRRVATTRAPLFVHKVVLGQSVRAGLHPVATPNETLVLMVSRDALAPSRAPANAESARTNAAPASPVEEIESKINSLGELDKLTKRELQILALIGQGLSSAQIAETISRSIKTVEWHRASLGSKLSVKSRVELARIAIRAGLSDVSPSPNERGPDLER